MTAALGRTGNASSLHAAGRRRPPRGRGVPGADRRRARRPARRRSCFTGGGTESDNLAVKGLYWARRGADPRAAACSSRAVEHHAVLDSARWLAEHEGAEVELAAGRPRRPGAARDPRPRARRRPGVGRRWSSVMWANNEVGTVQPVARAGRGRAPSTACRSTPTPCRRSGSSRWTSPRPGVDALTLTGHKLGGPLGVGRAAARPGRAGHAAAARRRPGARRPLRHAGHRRDRRPRHRRRARGGARGRERAAAIGGAARRPGRRIRAPRSGRRAQRRPRHRLIDGGPRGCPATRTSRFPGCEGDSLLHAARRARHRVLHRLGLLGRGAPSRSHVLLAMGADEDAPAARCGSPSATPRPRPTSTRSSTAVIGAGRRAARRPGGRGSLTVLTCDEGARRDVRRRRLRGRGRAGASTPGTTSPACTWRCPQTRSRSAPARAAAARWRTPRDARRAADVLGIPFYVWDLAERFPADVVDDFVAEYAAGRTPNPCLRCNEKIKFAARARPGARARLRRGLHRPLRPARRRACCAARVDAGKDQSYVLAVLTADQLRARDVPARRHDQGRRPGGGRARAACAVADKPDCHDICFIADGDTARLPAPRARRAAGPGRRRRPAPRLGRHDGAYGFTVGQRRGLRIGRARRRRPPALRARDRAGDRHGHASARRRRWTSRAIDGGAPGVDAGAAPGAVRARGAGARARRPRAGRASCPTATRVRVELAEPAPRRRPRPGGGVLRRRRVLGWPRSPRPLTRQGESPFSGRRVSVLTTAISTSRR